ncbi:hypothetical protein ACFLUH_02740 [Chloroflexota bacterium]
MPDSVKQQQSNQLILEDAEAIRHLKQALADGSHWYIALLEAIKLWDVTEETYNGQTYRYLIDGEALDWLLLIERLCQTVDFPFPEDEKYALLFQLKPPINITQSKFKELIGNTKYRQYLNYFYGITVEEALILAVQDEVRKERRILSPAREQDTTNEAYRRIYDATKAILLKHFRKEKGGSQLKSISLTELKEFTYWLFKYRLDNCDPAKVASDTKKGLEQLNKMGFPQINDGL